MTREEAKALIDALLSLREGATDAQASGAAALYPTLKGDGSHVKVGTRINWRGTIKRAANDLWDREDNNPDNAPALWEDIAYKKGYRIIPEVITAGTAFAQNECGWWGDVLYKAKYPATVHTPAQYPDGWEVVQ